MERNEVNIKLLRVANGAFSHATAGERRENVPNGAKAKPPGYNSDR